MSVETLKSLGLHLRPEWLARHPLAVAAAKSGDVVSASKGILLDVLQADLHICGAPCLPADLKTADKMVLKGPLVLQVDEWVDIGPGASNTSDDAPKRVSRSRAIKFAVTDGTVCTSALEAELIPQLNDAPRSAVTPIDDAEAEGAGAAASSSAAAAGSGGAAARAPPHILQPGCKLVVREVLVRHGMLILRPSNCLFLGGSVQRLQDLRRHAIRELAKTRLTNKQLIKQKSAETAAAGAAAAAPAAAASSTRAAAGAAPAAAATGSTASTAAASSVVLRSGPSGSAAVGSGLLAPANRAAAAAGSGASAAPMLAATGGSGAAAVPSSAQRPASHTTSADPAGSTAVPSAAVAAMDADEDDPIANPRRPAPLAAASISAAAAAPSARTTATGDDDDVVIDACIDDSGIAPFDTGYGTGPDTDVDVDEEFNIDLLQEAADEEARQRAGSRQAAPAASAADSSAHARSQPASAARRPPPSASADDDIVVVDNDDDDEDIRRGPSASAGAPARAAGAAAAAAVGSAAARARAGGAAASRSDAGGFDDDELMNVAQFSPRVQAPDTLPDETGAASSARDGRMSASFDDDTQADGDGGFDAPLALLPLEADAGEDDATAAAGGAAPAAPKASTAADTGGVQQLDDVLRSMLRSGTKETTQVMQFFSLEMADYDEDDEDGQGRELIGQIACSALDGGTKGSGMMGSRLDTAVIESLSGCELREILRRVRLEGKENKKLRQAAKASITQIADMFDNKLVTARCRLYQSATSGWRCHVLELVLP